MKYIKIRHTAPVWEETLLEVEEKMGLKAKA